VPVSRPKQFGAKVESVTIRRVLRRSIIVVVVVGSTQVGREHFVPFSSLSGSLFFFLKAFYFSISSY